MVKATNEHMLLTQTKKNEEEFKACLRESAKSNAWTLATGTACGAIVGSWAPGLGTAVGAAVGFISSVVVVKRTNALPCGTTCKVDCPYRR